MFDIDGGLLNVLIAGLNILSIVFFIVLPVMFSMTEDKFRTKQIVIAAIGLFIYCFLLYVANPSLTFWAVK